MRISDWSSDVCSSDLILKGVGYKAFLTNTSNVELKIGYSHSIDYSIPNSVNIDVFKNLILQINSPLKDSLGSISASIKGLKKIDIYKGKGILYKREKLNLKTRSEEQTYELKSLMHK